jgi:hypothetical protein
MLAGPYMLTVAPLHWEGRQEVLQQEKGGLAGWGPLGPRLAQSSSGRQHTEVALIVGAVNEGFRKLLQVSQQATLVASLPGHTGHTAKAWQQQAQKKRVEQSREHHALALMMKSRLLVQLSLHCNMLNMLLMLAHLLKASSEIIGHIHSWILHDVAQA